MATFCAPALAHYLHSLDSFPPPPSKGKPVAPLPSHYPAAGRRPAAPPPPFATPPTGRSQELETDTLWGKVGRLPPKGGSSPWPRALPLPGRGTPSPSPQKSDIWSRGALAHPPGKAPTGGPGRGWGGGSLHRPSIEFR